MVIYFKGGIAYEIYFKRHINLGIIFIVLSVITLVVGITKWPFFIFSAILISSYIILDKKKIEMSKLWRF